MPHVQEAANLVVSTCELLFRKRRWNCSSLRKLPVIKADLDIGESSLALSTSFRSLIRILTYTYKDHVSHSSTRHQTAVIPRKIFITCEFSIRIFFLRVSRFARTRRTANMA